jgi:hypothetical protein
MLDNCPLDTLKMIAHLYSIAPSLNEPHRIKGCKRQRTGTIQIWIIMKYHQMPYFRTIIVTNVIVFLRTPATVSIFLRSSSKQPALPGDWNERPFIYWMERTINVKTRLRTSGGLPRFDASLKINWSWSLTPSGFSQYTFSLTSFQSRLAKPLPVLKYSQVYFEFRVFRSALDPLQETIHTPVGR